MQSHSKAYKAIVWPELWPAPIRRPSADRDPHMPRARPGLGKHHTVSSLHNGSRSCWRNRLVLQREPNPNAVWAAAQVSSPPCLLQGPAQVRSWESPSRRESKRAPARSRDAEPGVTMWTEPHSSEMVRAAPLPSPCGGHGPEGASPAPPSSQNDSAEAAQHFTSLLRSSARNTPMPDCS